MAIGAGKHGEGGNDLGKMQCLLSNQRELLELEAPYKEALQWMTTWSGHGLGEDTHREDTRAGACRSLSKASALVPRRVSLGHVAAISLRTPSGCSVSKPLFPRHRMQNTLSFGSGVRLRRGWRRAEDTIDNWCGGHERITSTETFCGPPEQHWTELSRGQVLRAASRRML